MQEKRIRVARRKFTIGNRKFAGEGDQDWLDQHMNLLIETFSQSQFNIPSRF